ncbi:hypothetical protein ABL78_4649 [Leptomonas seymouri]|uniref:RING-type domain-containing protein n=1 Tax=Leptomonas seymouri TaxID=5684 RepID=A0A0N1I4M4_LEPSE|nr:hypothetical protein ABL78_4649 [Leptomonas seymouri]|eukprot:KPI86302.1 hypothetical protein ABL78_4649 [Leptomonas seymouri]
MSAFAKEFETTSQLPPSTPQQRMTPPTVLLPTTFAILPPQSAALSAALAATAAAPNGTPASSLSMPLLGHSIAASASPNVALAAGPGASSSMVFGAAPVYAAVDLGGCGGGSSPAVDVSNALNELNTSVSETASSGISAVAVVTACAGNRHPLQDREVHQSSKSSSSWRPIQLRPPSVSTPPEDTSPPEAAAAGGAAAAVLNFSPLRDPHQQPQHRPVPESPAKASGSQPSTADEDDLIPLTSTTSTYATRRSVSALDNSALETCDRAGGSGSRAHSCSSRSGSMLVQQRSTSAVAAALRLTTPTAYGHGAHSDLLWQRDGWLHAPGATTGGLLIASTPSPIPSASNTPPTTVSRACASQTFPFYPSRGTESVHTLCPTTSCVETALREEPSGGKGATCSRSQPQQRRCELYMPSGCTPPSHVDGHASETTAAAAAAIPSLRRHHAHAHVSLHTGSVMMTAAVTPNAGRKTPTSSLYIAPAMYLHADLTRNSTTSGGVAALDESSPYPLSMSDVQQRVGGSGRGAEGGESWPLSNAAATGTSNASCEGFDALGQLSGFSSPLASHGRTSAQQQQQQQQQQQHTLLADSCTRHSPYRPPLGNVPATTTATNAFSGNLTFLPIEVQPVPTFSPFFGSRSNRSTAGVLSVSATGNICPQTPAGDGNSFQEDSATSRVATTPQSEYPVCSLDEASSSSCCCPQSTATPPRVHTPWHPYAAPGLVTAILAAPEISCCSFTTTGTAAAIDGGEEETFRSVTASTDLHSASTYHSSACARSPTPWLQQADCGSCSSSNDKANACPARPSSSSHCRSMGYTNPAGGVKEDDEPQNRGTLGHAVGANFHLYSAALPSYRPTIQFQLSCTPVPLEDTESECVICFEGHPSAAKNDKVTAENNARGWCASDATAESTASSEMAARADFGGGVKPGSQLLMMPCNHCCHQNCLQRWLIQSTCCPICRRDLSQDATLSA